MPTHLRHAPFEQLAFQVAQHFQMLVEVGEHAYGDEDHTTREQDKNLLSALGQKYPAPWVDTGLHLGSLAQKKALPAALGSKKKQAKNKKNKSE